MLSPETRAVIVGQLSQKSTVAAIISAVVLLLGWGIAPEKLDAVATLVAIANSAVLAVIQERPPAAPKEP